MPVSTTARTFFILTLAACGMACLLALLPAAGHDQMWLLYVARLMLHGAPLYGPTTFETNPPLILWLSSIPEYLANLTHLPDTAVGKFCTLLVLAFIGAFCYKLLRKLRPNLSLGVRYALLFTYITVFAVMPARDLGQRDDFLIFFLLPYVFAAAVRLEGLAIAPIQAFFIGALSLCGVALKPHQVLVVVAVEFTLLLLRSLKTRRFSLTTLLRPEVLGLFTAGILFLIAIHRFAPFYFTVNVPLARDTYWAYSSQPPTQILLNSIQLHLLFLVDLALLARLGWRQSTSLIRVLFLAGLAALFAFYLQDTGWYYQQLPALSLLSLALFFLILELAERHPVSLPRWTVPAAAALALLALALTTHFMGYPFTAERSFPIDQPDPAFFAGIAPGTPVMTLSPTVDDTIQPLFKYHLTLGERNPAFLLLPALLRSEDPQGKPLPHTIPPARLAELDRIQRTDMLEDLARWHPQLLLVERCQDPATRCQVLEDRHDNLLAWFLRDPAFAAILSHYTFAGSKGAYDAWKLVTPY